MDTILRRASNYVIRCVGMLKRLRYPSTRQALFAALFTGVLLLVFVVLWLTASTRTAQQNERLADLEARQEQIIIETSQLLKEIGDQTSPQNMVRRMREAGFAAPETIEFLLPVPTVAITPTTQGGTP